MPALVETKFFRPQLRDGSVPRPRLDAQLGPRSRLTLVSAPAGFGKTTVVGSWLADHASATGARVAWVSLDAADRDPVTFWTYVLTALDRAAPGTGSAGLTVLEAGQPVEAGPGAGPHQPNPPPPPLGPPPPRHPPPRRPPLP